MMTTLEIEGAERGWLASVGLDPAGQLVVRAALSREVGEAVGALLEQLLQEPLDGRPLGIRRGEELLRGLALVLGRRRPLLAAERVHGYLPGVPLAAPDQPLPPGWDEP
ncbi:MAG TPA: hypothetical protein VFB73_08720 [Chloroflexota bacterium]|nr:hypothetical protein [Chloroflexota bacterium]